MEYDVRFTTYSEPYRIQREVISAESAQQASDIMYQSGVRVVDVEYHDYSEDVDPRTPAQVDAEAERKIRATHRAEWMEARYSDWQSGKDVSWAFGQHTAQQIREFSQRQAAEQNSGDNWRKVLES